MSVVDRSYQCDACGAQSPMQKDSGGYHHWTVPVGWLHGNLALTDALRKDVNLWGHICEGCSELPVRDLLCRWHARAAERNARLA
jgi:hypothetical protein